MLELLRGESAEELSRKYCISMAELSAWRDEFIENGMQGFKKNHEESKLARAERRIGQCCETKKRLVSILLKEVYEKTGAKYPTSMVLRVAGCSSGNWYGKKPEVPLQKRGPKPQLSDDELLSPYRHDKAMVKVRKHEGKIVQGKPDLLWGTDGKKFFVEDIGWCWFFGVLDHFNDELISWHTCKRGTRYEAMEPVRAAVRKRFGTVAKDVCKVMALKLRSDYGSQYDSNDFMAEMKFLGLNMSKAFVRQPECNGCIERFHRTLEEEVFSLNHFKTLEEANEAIRKFVDNYNRQWLIYRLGYKSPLEYREEYERKVA